MKINLIRKRVVLVISLFATELCFAQGFVNLNFERTTIPPTLVGGWAYPVDSTQALPGWTVGGAVIMYNDLSLGSPAVSLMGPNFPNFAGYTPLQGSYSVLMQYFGYAGGPPTLSQTGLVPANAQSISFLVPAGQNDIYAAYTVVSLNGLEVPLVPITGGRVGGNISAFAGSVAQLTFSTINANDWIYFDDIQFSPSSVPEPSALALGALGALLFGLIVSPKRA
jgi:hypothetical protein